MPKDHEGSLGDEHTLQGGMPAEASSQSLGDQSTFGGGDSSSMADLTGLGADDGLDMEIVDLSSRYKVERVLGKGGMGEVLLATDTRLERKVAIKRILGDATQGRTAVTRFLTEAKAIAALSHANVVQIYDYGRDKDGPFLIMEFVNGGSLLDRCREGVLPLEEAVDLTCQLCDGLAKAHEAGIIHRDIKPANILLTKDGVPKLTDFGLAKAESTGNGQTVAGAVLGTVDFMPPEQRRDATLTDARSDLWSLAATLYQMVTGEPPSVVDLEVVPQQLRATLGRALKARKEERFQTAREFKAALRSSLQSSDSGGEQGTVVAKEGVCPNCATHNEPHRKFCKQCASSLRVGCLSCRAVIPIWDEVCPECGAQQSPLVLERVAALEKMQSDAEFKLEICEFAAARELAEALVKNLDARFPRFATWSKQFLDELEARRAEQLSRAGELMSEAMRHEAAHDYASAITTLNQIPRSLFDATVPNQAESPSTVLRRVESKHEECRDLEKSIRQAIASKQLNELLVEVDRLLELRPDRQDVQKLRLQLVDRQAKRNAMFKEAFAAAQVAMRACDYDSVLTHLGRIDSAYMQWPMRRLEEDAKSKRVRRDSLQKSIQERLGAKNYVGLMDLVRELLELSPNDEALIQLQDRLIVREQQLATKRDQVITQVRGLQRTGQFAAALQQLQAIPKESQDSEMQSLVADLKRLAEMQTSVRQVLRDDLKQREYDFAEDTCVAYRVALNSYSASDPEFEQRYLIFAATKHEAAVRKRFLAIGSSGIAAVILLILAMVAINAIRREHAENQAQETRPAEEQTRLSVAPAAEGTTGTSPQPNQQPANAADLPQSLSFTFDANRALEHQLAWAKKLGVPVVLKNSIGMELKLLPPGTFTMGSAKGDPDEQPHLVNLTKPFYVAVYEVTQEQYQRVMRKNPSRFADKSRNPVEQVAWLDAIDFCRGLSELPEEKAARRSYRLPTEAEWEYACRAGDAEEYGLGDNTRAALTNRGWCSLNSGDKSQPVGTKIPNLWGVYDMHGNVWEWCQDWYADYPADSATDPTGALSGSHRVNRGGSWNSAPSDCSSTYRSRNHSSDRFNDLGFRVVLPPSSE